MPSKLSNFTLPNNYMFLFRVKGGGDGGGGGGGGAPQNFTNGKYHISGSANNIFKENTIISLSTYPVTQ